MSIGLGPTNSMAVKLLYRKYLELLDRTFDKPLEDRKVGEGSSNTGRRLGFCQGQVPVATKEPVPSLWPSREVRS